MEDTFKPLKITVTQEMLEWNFNKIDKDGSGRISFSEYT
jgi:Ca2+-binding EF-hand superfamily protein